MKLSVPVVAVALALAAAGCGTSHHDPPSAVADNSLSGSTAKTASSTTTASVATAQATATASTPAAPSPTVSVTTASTVAATTSTTSNAALKATPAHPGKKRVKPKPTPAAATTTTPTTTTASTTTATTTSASVPTSTTTASGEVITVAGSPNADPTETTPAILKSPPKPTGADPGSGPGTPISCLTAAGLEHAFLEETSAWEAYGKESAPYFVDGPFANHAAAEADANTLTPVEYVAVGGDYVVQTPLTNSDYTPLLSVASCLTS